MNATKDLIAAALRVAGMYEPKFEDEREAVDALRELCARAMVQQAPDMAEVERRVRALPKTEKEHEHRTITTRPGIPGCVPRSVELVSLPPGNLLLQRLGSARTRWRKALDAFSRRDGRPCG